MFISKSTVKRILKDAGASRVSNEALLTFQKMINKEALDVAAKAVTFAKHAKRKTVEPSDLKLAFE